MRKMKGKTGVLQEEAAKQKILDSCPEDAGITSILFDVEKGEVIIEARKPGLVVGRGGLTLKLITEAIGWRPTVIRAGEKDLPSWKKPQLF